DGGSWEALPGGLPTTFVSDMVVHPRDHILVASTHGRGMFAMDVSYIEQLTPEVLAEGVHVFEIEDAPLGAGGGRFGGGFGAGGGAGAYVGYWLADAGPVSLVVRDAGGETVRELTGTGDAGFNYATWDLTREGGPAGGRGRGGGGGGGRGRFGGAGRVDPGTYTVVLTQRGRTAEATIIVVR
ncbi:MAG TPA: hypothetical protein VE173_07885, partial [Longimicrobiales bacterium]|nr:hypothetical protein [Longimicrobiales bacterium]